MKKLKTLSLLFLLSLLANNLTAQTWIATLEEEADKIETTIVDRISFRTMSDVSNFLSFPETLVSQTELEPFSFNTPADALQRQAGISLVRDGIWASSVNIRGLSGERILILADGNRLTTANEPGALSSFDLNNIIRIEVIRGAASVLHGTGAMGGVINFITESAYQRYTNNLTSSGRVGTGFSSVNNLWTNHARVRVSENNWFLAANGSYRQAQDMRSPIGVLVNSQFEDWSFGIQGGMLHNDSQELLINFQHFEARNVGVGESSFLPLVSSRDRSISRNLLSGEYIFHRPNFSLFHSEVELEQLRLQAYTQSFARDFEQSFFQSDLLLSSRNTTNGGKITADWWTAAGWLITGIDLWENQIRTSSLRTQRLAENSYSRHYAQTIPNSSMLNLGVFAQYAWEGRRIFDIKTGLRFDHIRVSNDSLWNPIAISVIENGRETFEEDIVRRLIFPADTRNEFSYSAHIDFVYEPSFRHRFVLSLSKAHRAPSLEERFQLNHLLFATHVGNPNLRPERGGFSNLAYRFEGRNLSLNVNIFANYILNMITATTQYPEFQTLSGLTTFHPTLVNTNIDEAFMLGGELDIVYRINRDFWLTANASYASAIDIQTNDFLFLPQIPPLRGMAALHYRIPDVLTASVSANFATLHYPFAMEGMQTDGFVVMNANISSARIPLNSTHLHVSAGIDNIFNTVYNLPLHTARMGFSQAEPGRNFYVRAQFGW